MLPGFGWILHGSAAKCSGARAGNLHCSPARWFWLLRFDWEGDDGVRSNHHEFKATFSRPGKRRVSIIMSSNGQSITRDCSVLVTKNGTLIREER